MWPDLLFQETTGPQAALVFGIFLRLFALLYAVQLAYAATQVIPWCGSRGVFPFARLKTLRRELFPGWHLLYWPAQWLPSSDTALVLVCLAGSAGAVAYAILGSMAGFYGMGLALLLLNEPATMQWPWHHLSTECWWVLVFASLGGGAGNADAVRLVSLVQKWDPSSLAPPGPLLLVALRLLLFRLLFGFGKTKFSGSTRKDWMYIRPFLVGVPIATPLGLWAFRQMPRAFFLFSYGVFFMSEVIAPLTFWLPMPWRGLAAGSTVALMMGIQLTGNFGSFNSLTATLALPLLLDPQWGSLLRFERFSLGELLLALYIPVTLPLILFQSWVAAAWWQYPALVRGLPKFSRFYEFLALWRIAMPYGIFPAPIFSALRHMPRFEVSDDGKHWEALHYRFQPTSAAESPRWCPVIHPMLDFVVFYSVGYGGFMKSIFDMRNPVANIECRPINAIARAILNGGPVISLFGRVPAFMRTGSGYRAPKYVRVVVVALQPLESPSTSGAQWQELPGTMEIPPVSLDDVDGPWLPAPYIANLDQMDPTFVLWRQRSALASDLTNEFNGLVSSKRSVLGGGVSRQVLEDLLQCGTLDDATRSYQSWSRKLGPRGVEEVQRTMRRAGMMILNALEGPCYGSVPTAKHNHFDLYLYSLSRLGDGADVIVDSMQMQRANIVAELADRNKPWFRQGTVVLAFLFPSVLQIEASVYRRLRTAKQLEFDVPDEVQDAIAPPMILMRCIAKNLSFPGETLHSFTFNAKRGEYEYEGARQFEPPSIFAGNEAQR